jgi:hypothetical protein
MAIWYILWLFGIFCGHWYIISPFWYVVPRKSGNPAYVHNSKARYDGWNPVPWYEQRGFNVTTMHLAPGDHQSSSC